MIILKLEYVEVAKLCCFIEVHIHDVVNSYVFSILMLAYL